MGLFKSGRELNRWADECAALVGAPTADVMRLTGEIAKATGGQMTRGEALAVMLASLRLLDEHQNATMAGMVMSDRFDDGSLMTHHGKPLRDTVPAELAFKLFVKTIHTFRPQYIE